MTDSGGPNFSLGLLLSSSVNIIVPSFLRLHLYSCLKSGPVYLATLLEPILVTLSQEQGPDTAQYQGHLPYVLPCEVLGSTPQKCWWSAHLCSCTPPCPLLQAASNMSSCVMPNEISNPTVMLYILTHTVRHKDLVLCPVTWLSSS